MRKGFKETLATVAIATLGFNAMAMAPVIDDIPDVIVGDVEHSSENNVFVFEDAINLDSIVEDDETEVGSIQWSYSVTDPGNNRYRFNDVGPVSGPSGAIIPGSNRIDSQDNDPVQADGNPRTVTIRDELRSPVAEDNGNGPGQGPYPNPAGGPGVLPDSRTVTLFASDGSTVGMESFIIYSEDGGEDGFSPREEIVQQFDFRTGVHGWVFANNAGTANQSQDNTNGLCLDVPAAGDNDGVWISPYDSVSLVQNSVWEARMTVSTSQTTAGNTPLWMFVYENFGSSGEGQNEYGGQMFYLDNEGGTNSPISGTGRSDFRMFMSPIPIQTAHFSDEANGFFSEDVDANNDMRMQFRIFDYADAAAYGAESDEGSVCFQDLTVIRHDLGSMVNLETVFEVDSFTDSSGGPAGANGYHIDDAANATNIQFSGGNVILGPNGNAWDGSSVTLFRPGYGGDFDPTNAGGVNNDLYPVTWEPDTIYYIEFELSAPTADDESNPPDVIRVGADTITNELVMDHNVIGNTPDFSTGELNTRGLSMPRTGDPQKYSAFFYSHSQTASAGINDPQRWRPRFEILTAEGLQPIGRATNTGSIEVHSVSVQKVEFR